LPDKDRALLFIQTKVLKTNLTNVRIYPTAIARRHAGSLTIKSGQFHCVGHWDMGHFGTGKFSTVGQISMGITNPFAILSGISTASDGFTQKETFLCAGQRDKWG
jgi:hypothetical protein